MMAGRIGNEASSSSSSSSGSNNNRGESIVTDVGKRRSSCGYCKLTGRTSVAHGLWADSITVDDYQDLLDRGWRRSGIYIYKPEMEKTCCPSYTIRLKAADFVASKEQLRVSRRIQRFLDGTLDGKSSGLLTDESNTCNSTSKESLAGDCEQKNEEERYLQSLSHQIDNVIHSCTESGIFPSEIQLPKASVKKITHTKKKIIGGSEDLLYSSNISFQIAAAFKRTKLVEKNIYELGVLKDGVDGNGQSFEVSPKNIAEKLACSLNQLGGLSNFSTRACNGHLNFYSATRQVPSGDGVGSKNASLPRAIGGKHSSKVENTKSPQPKRILEIRLKRSCFDPEEYALYRRYQIRVHNDKPDQVVETSYRRFLVDTPIVYVPPSGDNTVPPCGFGSFHQQYIVDGRLVAVGVVDILPKCLSSKYLFWDPDFAFLSLGKYSALQEINWVKENQTLCPSLQYYYLGYYIHSCSKMRYKAAYYPSELLCPLRYQWVSFDISRPLLDRKPYVILSDFETLQNGQLSPRQLPENSSEPLHRNGGQEDPVETFSDEDEEMVEPEFEEGSDDDDLGSETSESFPNDEIQDGNVGNILIGLRNSRMRFKDIQRAFSSSEKIYLEAQLHRYMKAVGTGLSERMVYSLG